MRLLFRLMMVSETLATAKHYPQDCENELEVAQQNLEEIITRLGQNVGQNDEGTSA